MDFPFGHPQHPHRHHRDEGQEEYPPRHTFDPPPPAFDPPPPSYYGANEPPPPPQVYHSSHGGRESYPPPVSDYYAPPPPPPQVTHVYHSSHAVGESYPPPISDYYSPPPPPLSSQGYDYSGSHAYPASSVQHVSHDVPLEATEREANHHHYRPHLPSFHHHHTHHEGSELTNKPTVRLFCKAETNYSLTITHGKVILSPSNSSDPFQHWIKDEKYSTRVKDEEGFPCFALVNKATGQAMKHSIGESHPVQLIPYNPDVLDESILWTESKDMGDGFRAIRMVNNIRLNVDAFHGDKNSGGVHDGTTIVLWKWNKGDNQQWKIIPY